MVAVLDKCEAEVMALLKDSYLVVRWVLWVLMMDTQMDMKLASATVEKLVGS